MYFVIAAQHPTDRDKNERQIHEFIRNGCPLL